MSEPTGVTPAVATAGDPSPAQAAHHEALNEIAQLEDLAQTLRRELLPTSTPRPEVHVAVDYVPAMNAIGFGGDWFDTVDPDEHRLVLIVGDVAGHGARAAARMALAQGAVRGLAMSSTLGHLPWLATRALTGSRPEFFATVGLIEVDLRTMSVAAALAGHPPPMLRGPDGTVTRLGGDPAPPIGLVDAPRAEPLPIPLMAGSLIVLYSDGLVERRGENLADRLDRLQEVVSDLDSALDAERALSEICNEMLTDDSEDDVAILVARVAGHP